MNTLSFYYTCTGNRVIIVLDNYFRRSNKSGVENRAFEYEMSEPQRDIKKIDKNANNNEKNGITADDFDDINERCGLGCFTPDWIQQFATKRAFMVVFTLLGVIQGMSWSYFSATISTLEKRFKISSETAGKMCTC